MSPVNRLRLVLALIALLGIADATYLTALHYADRSPICIPGLECEVVLGSQYATVWGTPISLFGVLFYLTVLGLTLWSGSDQRVRPLLVVLTSLGLIVSAYLVYLQAVVLKAFCQYCLVSAGLSVLLFIGALVYARSRRATV